VDGRYRPFSYLGGLSSNARAKKCLYLKAHASNDLASPLSVEIKDEIEIEYGWLEIVNLL
jgi:hypothetical protein